jgi:hypothetical protein
MSTTRPLIAALLAALAVAFSGCTTKTSGPPQFGREREEAKDPRDLYLYSVEIDPMALAQGARPLFNEPPPGVEFGAQRRVQGYLKFSDQRTCRAEIKVAEPVIGGDGRQTQHLYTLLAFFGSVRADRSGATVLSGGTPTEIDLGQVTDLTFTKLDDEKLVVQAYSGRKPLAYKFFFHTHPIMDRNVPFPHKVSGS